MNYQTADEKLQGRNKLSRKVGNNTYLVRNSGVPGDSIHLKLHNTYIITWFADGRIELNSGGYRTVTTKARINEFLAGFGVSQERGVWYLTTSTPESYWSKLVIFEDGLVINPDGTVTGGSPIEDTKKALKLRKRVNAFATNYIAAFKAGDVPAPSSGDCWYCLMKNEEGNTLGEIQKSAEHILSHLEEEYYVPSLLSRAFETMPHSQAMGWAIASKWAPEQLSTASSTFLPDFVFEQLRKILTRYILRQLGQAS